MCLALLLPPLLSVYAHPAPSAGPTVILILLAGWPPPQCGWGPGAAIPDILALDFARIYHPQKLQLLAFLAAKL